VSKAIDREAGAERQVVGEVTGGGRLAGDNYQSSVMGGGWHGVKITEPASDASKQWSGWGTALKPAHEPIVVARKPFKGTVAANVLAHGTGAINIDGCRVGTDGGCKGDGSSAPSNGILGNGLNGHPSTRVDGLGRWPANVIHDGSDEVLMLFPEAAGGNFPAGSKQSKGSDNSYGVFKGNGQEARSMGDSGSAARFFYCAKASKRDREDGLDDHDDRILNRTNPGGIENDPKWAPRVRKNNHPTVKPTDLMRYLCRLITPPGGIVLDPFAGSGSTGRGAVLEGFSFIGIEMDSAYVEIAKSRIKSVES
jgi:site-specific DNA-methyltransferase (adenine-specific)